MQSIQHLIIIAAVMVSGVFASAQTAHKAASPTPVHDPCLRYQEGSIVTDPPELRSVNGLLKAVLTIRNSVDQYGHMRYCYTDEHGNQAPTLRLHPGDTLSLTLRNEISLVSGQSAVGRRRVSHDPCAGGAMTPDFTNLHFHGLAISPVCHQDESLKTAIAPGESFEYRFQIPRNHAPGLYWYHPHSHGFSEDQVLGGASGALIIEEIERAKPQVAGLPERVFVIRDEKMPEVSAAQTDANRPTKELSVNYVPVPYPKYPSAVVRMRPSERQFWRVVNAAADTYLDLHVEFAGKAQTLSIVALDGVPLRYGQGASLDYMPQQTTVFLPPGARAEFIFTGPAAGVSGLLVTNFVYRGASDENGRPVPAISSNQPGLRTGQDDVDPTRPLATLVAAPDAPEPRSIPAIANSSPASSKPASVPLASARPVRKRTLYFSEKAVNPADPKTATLFFITEEGSSPAVFDPHALAPNITVHQGEVEDWTIENRSQESHAFHVHQLHFVVVRALGVPWEEPTLRDTINLPAWDGRKRYPSVTVRMDFRDPAILGTFPYHCHIMQHIDGGMMGTVRVEPAVTMPGR